MSDNSWYEKGDLPPVGIDVEYCGDITGVITKDFKVGDKLKCISHEYMSDSLMPVFWSYRVLSASTLVSSSYRPIKTERELAIESAWNATNHLGYEHSAIKEIAGELFKLGLLRSKNES